MAKKFEYKRIHNSELEDEKLMRLGQEGWEMAGIISGGSSSILFFKREIESPLTHKQERNSYDMTR